MRRTTSIPKKPRYIAVPLPLKGGPVKVYASPRIAAAFKDIAMDMNMYKGIKLLQLLTAVYKQGHKDGARAAFESTDARFRDAMKAVPHQNPGRPSKKKRRS